MNWFQRLSATNWNSRDIPAMMVKAFNAIYSTNAKHGPFNLTGIFNADNHPIEVQFDSQWEGVRVFYVFDDRNGSDIFVTFSITKYEETLPNVSLSYPIAQLNQIPYELIKKTFELLDKMDDDSGGYNENVPTPQSPSYTTAQVDDENFQRDFQKMRDDLLREQAKKKFNEDPGEAIKEHHGVWQYPFAKVKKNNDGYFIDWFEEPGSIRYLEKVSVGDKVADHALNMTPYWEINFIDEDAGRIWLTPIEPNPFVTGVGAGGAEWNDHDAEVHSGDYEKKRIDNILKAIRDKQISSPSDVKYILKGTVPVHVGPNLSQGGWYSSSDTSSNRGGREGLSEQQIQMQDAHSLQKMGFEMPPLALQGKMSTRYWNDLVDGRWIDPATESEECQQLKLNGENWDDPQTCIKFIMENPVPEVKVRNWHALRQIFNPFPSRKSKLDEDETYESYYDKRNVLIEEYHASKYVRKEMLPMMHEVCKKIFELQKPNMPYDPYWLVKENAMNFAQNQGWGDVLDLYTNSKDFNVRESLVSSLSVMKSNLDPSVKEQLLIKLFNSETKAKIMVDILHSLRNIYGDKLSGFINSNADRIQQVVDSEKDGIYKYAAEELARYLTWANRSASNAWLGKIAKKDFLLRFSQMSPEEKRSRHKWRTAPMLGKFLLGSAGSCEDVCIYKVIKITEINNNQEPDFAGMSGDEEDYDESESWKGSAPSQSVNIPYYNGFAGKEPFNPERHIPVEIVDVFHSDIPNQFINIPEFKVGTKKIVIRGSVSTSFYKYIEFCGGISPIGKMRLLFGDVPRMMQHKYPKLIGGDLSVLVPEYNSHFIGDYNVLIVRGEDLFNQQTWFWYIPELRVSSEGENSFPSQDAAISSAEEYIGQMSL